MEKSGETLWCIRSGEREIQSVGQHTHGARTSLYSVNVRAQRRDLFDQPDHQR